MWVEILIEFRLANGTVVTPLAGVWVEIFVGTSGIQMGWLSLPLRECGLK